MKQIEKINNTVKQIFSNWKNFAIFPFGLIALIFISLFYILSPLYMLSDLFIQSLKSIIYENNEQDSNTSKNIKVLMGFGIVVVFNVVKSVLLIPLAIFYFITTISCFISSLGYLRLNPFAFSV